MPGSASKHLLMGMNITIPVLPSKSLYPSDAALVVQKDDCVDLPAFANHKILVINSLLFAILHHTMLKRLHYT